VLTAQPTATVAQVRSRRAQHRDVGTLTWNAEIVRGISRTSIPEDDVSAGRKSSRLQRERLVPRRNVRVHRPHWKDKCTGMMQM